MESKPINDPALRNLERTIRFEFERIILIMAIVCVSLEVAIFIYYYLTDNVGQPVNTYIEFRILVPLLVNSILYVITRFSNRSETSTDTTKNRVVSFAGVIMCGVIALAHSYLSRSGFSRSLRSYSARHSMTDSSSSFRQASASYSSFIAEYFISTIIPMREASRSFASLSRR